MRFNFSKISAIGASVLLAGMTMGVAAAANYPNPFVVGGAADVAIVYGTGAGVSALDVVEAGNIQTNLQSFMGGTGTTDASVLGEAASLDTSGTRIWLNTSLNTAKSTFTKTDLPTVLGDNTFSGNVDAKMTSTLKFFAGTATGADNSGKVIFAKQPKSNVDPVIGITMGTSVGTSQLYNASATFKAVEFNHSDSEGETITLFGQDFVVSTATDGTDLVLFSSAEQVSLSVGGTNPSSATVNVAGTDYLIELVTGSGTTSATIAVDGEQKAIDAGSSKKVGGIEVAVKTVTESTALDKLDVTLLVGSEKLTFTHGSTVTSGSDDDPIDGTKAYITGGPSAATGLVIAVYRPDSSHDAIVAGEPFVDPVFGSFKVDFVGMSSPIGAESRGLLEIDSSGDDSMSLTMTDDNGNTGTFEFAHNQSGMLRLLDDSNYTIAVQEMYNISEDEYIVLGNEDYGHLVQITQLYNSTGTDATKDKVKIQDVLSGTSYDTVFATESTGSLTIDGKVYTVTLVGASTPKASFKYPTSDSAATEFVLYPTLQTLKGAKVALYEPLTINLSDYYTHNGTYNDLTAFQFPDGDDYTSVGVDYTGLTSGTSNWTIGTIDVGLAEDSDLTNYTGAVTVGQLEYNFTSTGQANMTRIYLLDPETNANIDQPGLIIFEEKDDKNHYEALVVDLKGNADASSTNPLGVNDVLFSTPYGHYSASLASDSDVTKDIDWWGTLVTTDANVAAQKTVTISYPDNQIYAQIYVGEESAAITGGVTATGAASLGDVLVTDSQVSTVSTKNLIVVGGSCINSAAASLVGGAHCGASWTTATNVGAGEFLIKGYASSDITSKLALLVAGYAAADTVNAATYLRTQTVDTDKEYKGTSSTSAVLVTAEA